MQENKGFPFRKEEWDGDSGYHKRHTNRSTRRAERIACHLKKVSSFLDVGCNEGLVSEYLLKAGKVERATGIELSNAKVSSWLKDNEHFRFIQGDIEKLELTEKYECIFYGAVHHHIVRESGFDAAVDVFRRLAYSCTDKIYFETGQLIEGGRWGWQREIAKYFSNDEEHFWFLLQTIEPILKGFKVVGRFYIHGVRRYLCEISVKDVREKPLDVNFQLPEIREEQDFFRGVGGGCNGLHSVGSNMRFFGPCFKKIETDEGDFFIKQRSSALHVDFLEYQIGRSVDFDWFVSPLGLSESGIVFPWIQGAPLMKVRGLSKAAKMQAVAQVDAILHDAKSKIVSLPDSLFNGRSHVRIFDVVDFNVNNFLFENEELLVVDFEYFSGENSARNYLHFSKLYFHLGAFSKAVSFAVYGGCIRLSLAVKYSFYPFEVRVLRRCPSLFSWMLAKFKGGLGVALIKLFPRFSEK